MPRPKLTVTPKLQAKKRRKVEATAEESSSHSIGVVVPSVPCQAHAKAGDSASSSSAAAVSSVQWSAPWPCTQCKLMPWLCKCHRAEDKTPEHIQQEYDMTCKRVGVWEAVELQQDEADKKAPQLEPLEEHLPGHLWSCWKRKTMNTRHDLVCCEASCGERRPLTQRWRGDKGDWMCSECQNHNWGCRRWCNWTACPSNDWRCRCGNFNRGDRKICHRFVCGLPRPFQYD